MADYREVTEEFTSDDPGADRDALEGAKQRADELGATSFDPPRIVRKEYVRFGDRWVRRATFAVRFIVPAVRGARVTPVNCRCALRPVVDGRALVLADSWVEVLGPDGKIVRSGRVWDWWDSTVEDDARDLEWPLLSLPPTRREYRLFFVGDREPYVARLDDGFKIVLRTPVGG